LGKDEYRLIKKQGVKRIDHYYRPSQILGAENKDHLRSKTKRVPSRNERRRAGTVSRGNFATDRDKHPDLVFTENDDQSAKVVVAGASTTRTTSPV